MAGKKRNLIVSGFVLLMACFCCVNVYAAQEPLFRLDMDSLNLHKGVSVNLVITLENAQGARIMNIEGFNEFDLISQNSSSSTTIVNGAASYQITNYYTIMPKTAGVFTLKATIEYNGRTYETNELQVTVSDGSTNGKENARDLFVETILSHTEAYLGEKIVMTYVLYSRYSIDNFGFSDTISIDGTIVKNMPNDQLKSEYVYVDGERYVMYEVSQFTIDPLKSGVYLIPAFNFRVDVITDNGMGGGFGGLFRSTTSMYVQTEEKELTVKPLPSAGRPASFSGIVGELRVDGQYSRESMNYGESFVLSVMVSGICNLDGFKNVISVATPGFSVYETLKNTTESVTDNKYHVQKTFDVIIVPEKTGQVDMPPIPISYFNPAAKKYEIAEIPGVAIEVLGDMPQANTNNSGQAPVIETMRIEQVNYSDTVEGYFKIQMKKGLVYGILIGIAALLVLAAILSWLISNRKKQDNALRTLYKQMMGVNDIDEIYNLFGAMIKHCFKLSLKASSRNTIQSSLPDTDLTAQLTDIIDYVESPDSRGAKGYLNLKDKIKRIYPTIVKSKV